MEIIHEPPSPSSYTPLSTHQSQTPSSFYSSTPVLHHSSVGASLLLLSSDLASHPALAALAGPDPDSTNGASTNGDTAHDERLITNLDVWVTSERFLLYHPRTTTGLSIPYPSISLHAIQRLSLPSSPSAAQVQGLFMQISTSDDYDEDATISLTLIPSLTVPPGIPEPVRSPDPTVADLPTGEVESELGRREPSSPIQSLFAAVSACANLHPDPATPHGEDGDDDDARMGPPVMFEGGVGYESTRPGTGLPPPVPGSGGWITAENVGELFDEEGNFRGAVQGGGLGPGAGSVRGREEEGERGDDAEDAEGEGEGEGEGEENGSGSGNGHGEETKWRRTE